MIFTGPLSGGLRRATFYRAWHQARAAASVPELHLHDLRHAAPRDRAGTFEPQIVRKRQRRLGGVDEMVCSLFANGLTHGQI